jgi:Asp/Glu/hydantoin racemase
MKNETKKDAKEPSDQIDTQEDVSRRDFLATSTGTIAAASVLAAGAGASLLSKEASAAWPKTSDTPDPSKIGVEAFDVDPSVRWKGENGETGPHFNEERGYGNDEVTGWKGRNVYGATVGIVQIPARIPMIPGDMGNAGTFNFPVLYENLGDIDPFWVLSDKPHPEVLKRTIIASRRLEMQGVRSIIGNCGFFANYQPEVSKAITVPFFNGSLMQVPMALIAVGANKKVGVLTANAELLIPSPALKNSGVSEQDMSRVVIYGNEKGKEMNKITGEKGKFSPRKLEKELVNLAKKMVKKHPDVSVIILECTEFPPYAAAIQTAVQRSVWDFTTMTNFMHAGAMRTPFTGWL